MMKRIITHEMGTVLPKTVAELKTDVPLLAIVGTKDMMYYFMDFDFAPVKDFSKPLPPLGVVTKFSFQPVRDCRLVATDTVMLGSTTTKFSRNFRRGAKDRMAIATAGVSPEKTWNIFHNLGIAYEAFGGREEWTHRFTVGYDHPRGYRMIQGMKDIAGLAAACRPYIQMNQS